MTHMPANGCQWNRPVTPDDTAGVDLAVGSVDRRRITPSKPSWSRGLAPAFASTPPYLRCITAWSHSASGVSPGSKFDKHSRNGTSKSRTVPVRVARGMVPTAANLGTTFFDNAGRQFGVLPATEKMDKARPR